MPGMTGPPWIALKLRASHAGKSHFSYWGKKRAGVWIIFLKYYEEVIMTKSDPITHDPNGVIQHTLEHWLLQFLEDEADHLLHQVVFV